MLDTSILITLILLSLLIVATNFYDVDTEDKQEENKECENCINYKSTEELELELKIKKLVREEIKKTVFCLW